MTITICGSMQFYQKMLDVNKQLKSFGYTVYVPSGAYDINKNEAFKDTDEEKTLMKVEYDVIREHFQYISKSDAILVVNYEKKGIPGYVGGNTFLEMGLAFWHNIPIFLLNPVPEMDYVTEMKALQPIVLYGDLSAISAFFSSESTI